MNYTIKRSSRKRAEYEIEWIRRNMRRRNSRRYQKKNDLYWTGSKNNIADWLTRGKRPIDIDINSGWQAGPDFLRLPESAWPITRTPTTVQKLPEAIKVLASINIVNNFEEDTL